MFRVSAHPPSRWKIVCLFPRIWIAGDRICRLSPTRSNLKTPLRPNGQQNTNVAKNTHDRGNFHRVSYWSSCVGIDKQRIVAWIHQRWVWHTSALKDISHVMFYEDLEVGAACLRRCLYPCGKNLFLSRCCSHLTNPSDVYEAVRSTRIRVDFSTLLTYEEICVLR